MMFNFIKKQENILIFFIAMVLNLIIINKVYEIISGNYKCEAIGICIVVMIIYLIAYIKKLNKLEKIMRFLSIGVFFINVSVSAIYFLPKVIYLTKHIEIQELLKRCSGPKAMYIYFIISFLQPIILPLPEPITVMAGSTALGAFKGAVIGFAGTVLGIITMYLFIRATGGKFIEKFASCKQIEKFNNYIKKNEFTVILSLFILPILPDEAICVGAGLTKINLFKFISVAAIAKMITAFSLSYSVTFIKLNSWQIALVIICLLGIKKLIDFKRAKAI